jgi:ligand-binding sensor domain-containing protein
MAEPNGKMLALVLLLCAACASSRSEDYWVQTNGPFGATVWGTVRSPHSGTLLLATKGGGVFRSTDQGKSWHNTSLTDMKGSALAVDSNGVSYFGMFHYSSFFEGVYRSTDDGRTWSSWFVPPGPYAGVNCLAVDKHCRIYVGTGTGLFRSDSIGTSWTQLDSTRWIDQVALDSDGGILLGVNGEGLLRSTDEGVTWHQLLGVLDQMNALLTWGEGHLYAAFPSYGVLVSSDRGLTWKSMNQGLPLVVATAFSVLSNGSLLLGTSKGLFRRERLDTLWVSSGLSNCEISTLLPGGANSVLAGTSRGVFTSQDSGRTWASSNAGLVGTAATSISLDRTGAVFVTIDGGDNFYRSTNTGLSWEPLAASLPVARGVAHAIGWQGDLFLSTFDLRQPDGGGTLFHSTDMGLTWQDTALSSNDVNSLAIGKDGTVFAAGGRVLAHRARLHRSTDSGKTWNLVLSSYEYPFHEVLADTLGMVYVASDSGLRKSTDNGITWRLINAGLNPQTIRSLSLSGSHDLYAGTDDGVFFLPSCVETWQHLGLAGRMIWSLAGNEEGTLFAGTDGSGVYISDDGGATWHEENTGLLSRAIQCLTVDSSGYMFAGSYGNGVFRTAQPTTSIEPISRAIPSSYLLEQNYPNPFNPSTTISFQLPADRDANLAVYDLLGREVAILTSGKHNAGYHSATWVPANSSSGVYFARLRASDEHGRLIYTKTTKLLYVK